MGALSRIHRAWNCALGRHLTVCELRTPTQSVLMCETCGRLIPLKKGDVVIDAAKRETIAEILGDLFDYGPDGRTGGFTAAMIVCILSLILGFAFSWFLIHGS